MAMIELAIRIGSPTAANGSPWLGAVTGLALAGTGRP
jgi:hypothetical protein